jgi:hypothetical protein
VFFARFVIAEVDLRNNETNIVTVRHVSERTSGLPPVRTTRRATTIGIVRQCQADWHNTSPH